MRATGINHVSIAAIDLEESTRFYVELFGMERIPTPTFGFPVQWLRCGETQLHLFQREETAPRFQHIALTVDDIEEAYDRIRSLEAGDAVWTAQMVELPSGQVQLYLRDPAGNLVELNWPDVTTLDRSHFPELRRLEDDVPQRPDAAEARLYLDPVSY